MMGAAARRRGFLRFGLAAVCVAMLAVIGAEVTADEPGRDRTAAAGREPVEAAAPALGFAMPPQSAFAEVLARPLFSPSRRPGVQVGTLAASSSFMLVAIVITPEERHALLGFGQPLRVVRVGEGQEIGGWTVEAILPNKVVVHRADLREEVKARDSAAGTAASAVAVSGASDPPPNGVWRRPPHDQ